MSDLPHTWHYGLLAQWWDEFKTARPEELAYLRGWLAREGGPALDLGCGTGRLLLPLLQDGLDIDGCDLSPDMLALCQRRAAGLGLAPRLHCQAMHQLDLPRRYQAIYIWDSFGLGGQRQQDRAALRRCYDHLLPGGALLFTHELPYEDANWQYWHQGEGLPQPWPEAGRRQRTASGDEYEFATRLLDLDPLEQRMTLQSRMTLWRGGLRAADEEHTLQATLYFRNEVLLLLELAGFADVAVYGGYTELPATRSDLQVVFVARK